MGNSSSKKNVASQHQKPSAPNPSVYNPPILTTKTMSTNITTTSNNYYNNNNNFNLTTRTNTINIHNQSLQRHQPSTALTPFNRSLYPRTFSYQQPNTSLQTTTTNVPTPAYKSLPEKNIELPSSWSLWKDTYYKHRLNQPTEAIEEFSERVRNNSLNFLRKANEIRLNIVKEDDRLYSDRVTSRPISSINSCLSNERVLSAIKKGDEKAFTFDKKLPELTPEMIQKINEACIADPPSEALVEIDGTPILRKDVQTLIGLRWLNDEIVNAYLNLIVKRGEYNGKRVYTFNTFFYPKLRETGYAAVKRWTRRVDVFSYRFLIVPVHLGNHWCLAAIDFSNRTIKYYDSLGGGSNGCCDTLLDYLRLESNDKKKQDFDDENWQLIEAYYDEEIPKQLNCSDCGVFLCMYAEFITREAKLNFSQKDMPYFRKKMIYEIVTSKIIDY